MNNSISIPYMNLSVTNSEERNKLLSRIDKVLLHGRLINGPEVSLFEEIIAKKCNTKYAIGVSSGGSALLLALLSLDIGKGDEVIIPSMSWISTAHAVSMTGATPVFADINNDLNVSVRSIESMINDKTKAVIPVHFMGKMCDLSPIDKLCKSRGIYLIEDASQAFGASQNGIKSGQTGIVNCFSLNSMKLLASLGEAGVITTNNINLALKLKSLRYCGMTDKEHSNTPSLNHRLETIQAAALLERLETFEQRKNRRREIAHTYDNAFASLPFEFIPDSYNGEDVYYGYTLLIDDRDQFMNHMKLSGIETKIKHAPLMCDQLPYKECLSDIGNARKIVNRIVCIPNHEGLTNNEVKIIIQAVEKFYE